MSSDIHSKLLAFLASALARTGTEMAMRIEVEYKPREGYRKDTLRKWTREGDPEIFTATDPGSANADGDATLSGMAFVEALTSEIIDIAETRADSEGHGRHRFLVRVVQHYGERLTHMFTILPAFDSDAAADEVALVGPEGATGKELAPTATGLVSQLMRHLEARDRQQERLLGTMMQAVGHQANLLRGENTELRQQLAEKDRERMQWLQQLEEARSVEHDRQIEAQTVVAREERKTIATKKIAALLPVVVSKIATPDNAKPSDSAAPPSALAKLLQQFLVSLTVEERGAILTALSMEQQAVLMEIGRVIQGPGDSPLVATMVADLMHTFSATQLTTILTALSEEKRGVFVRILQLAQPAATAGERKPPPQKSESTNGTAVKEN